MRPDTVDFGGALHGRGYDAGLHSVRALPQCSIYGADHPSGTRSNDLMVDTNEVGLKDWKGALQTLAVFCNVMRTWARKPEAVPAEVALWIQQSMLSTVQNFRARIGSLEAAVEELRGMACTCENEDSLIACVACQTAANASQRRNDS